MSVAFEDMSEYAQHVVKTLDLEAHPEGGWYGDAAGCRTRENTTRYRRRCTPTGYRTQADAT